MTYRFFILLNFLSVFAVAAIKTETVIYNSGPDVLEGYVAFDDASKSSRPAVIVVHDWMGITAFTKEKVEQLAKEGYVAFAADVYGKDVRPKDGNEAGQLAGKFKNDRTLMRAHMKAALEKLISMKEVNAKKVVVMGYCFGGTASLELARSGADLVGTASFHGGLSNPAPADAKNIKGSVLVMHGADDPYVPALEVKNFKQEMKTAKINMQFISYPGAVHAFAVPSAGSDKSKGAAYNAEADKKSWKDFEKFLKKVM